MNSDKNLFIIGADSKIAKDYIKRYGHIYDNLVGIGNSSISYLDVYQEFEFKKINEQNRFDNFLKNINLEYSDIIFIADSNKSENLLTTPSQWNAMIDDNVKVLLSFKILSNYFSEKVSIVSIISSYRVQDNMQKISNSISIGLLEHLSLKLSLIDNRDIRVNTLIPITVKTTSSSFYLEKSIFPKIPYRKFVSVQNVSDIANFLLDDKSNSIRGQSITLNYE